ncbi:MAG TPA: DUF4167 domain-containing protein [Sphingomicrobium sp.]|nr:DUF4167 domain-containing protein [Sphingomicrobium sp.]
MISNRQGGRRRGRGGQRGQNLGGQPGNRQDNRQRGNAAQLLEKYKSLARDSQLAGDRVQTEYYLQYAEHYHRILGESRARYEEQRRARGEDLDDEDGDEDLADSAEDQGGDGQDDERSERPERRDRGRRFERDRDRDRDRRPGNGGERNGAATFGGEEDERIPLEVLPPAIGREETDGEEQEAARPRRRTRRPRAEDGEAEIAPAA